MHGLCSRRGITRGNIVGHSGCVAPERKARPRRAVPLGEARRLRLALPRPTKHLMDPLWSDSAFMLALERFGYDIAGTRKPPSGASSSAASALSWIGRDHLRRVPRDLAGAAVAQTNRGWWGVGSRLTHSSTASKRKASQTHADAARYEHQKMPGRCSGAEWVRAKSTTTPDGRSPSPTPHPAPRHSPRQAEVVQPDIRIAGRCPRGQRLFRATSEQHRTVGHEDRGIAGHAADLIETQNAAKRRAPDRDRAL